ncbi:putative membrane protein [Arthrobacter stackebrandtii]|uniref:Membrane protein n=1 Tax=Arthrobacter stackebrandtii TaxID=272161 RepID=A0ABS4Z1A8_9MICC|nr:alpha/beta-hydrolase family protein [Arthrobacter stackebrandtii]MBP2414615.1 putative membrane protein [Arthrobacter stackebrandtii]PYH01713.1 hypothetical protein CVV67_04450 [Arthrobacter stackebrandtii]
MGSIRTASLFGAIAGVAAAGLALTPSLVPRPAVFQGFLAGLACILAYVFAAWLCTAAHKFLVRRRLPAWPATLRLPVWLRIAAAAALLLYAVLVGVVAVRWQNDVRTHVEMPPVDGPDFAGFFVAALLTAAATLGVRWCLHRTAAAARRASGRAGLPSGFAGPAGVLAGVLVASLAATVLVSAALWGTDRVYGARNATTPAGISEPSSTHRSAGADSAVSWDRLGMQGRAFVGGGPTAAAIGAATGKAAKEPVRVYVGAGQEDSMAARAAVAVAELKRTGGFDRSVLMVATPTGSGWLERQAVDSLEYLHGGDTAIVSMQYSYQPSWVSFLFHQDLPRESAQALYAAVAEERNSMPAAQRPDLVVYGLSLGASGMQSAFSGAQDLVDSVDGAVFSGAPNNSQPWGTLQETRDAGSPEWQPVYQAGRNVRWLSNNGDFDALAGPWVAGRVAYLQHGTDAVTWLSPRLIWEKPDWLNGTAADGGRAPDVSDSMRRVPLFTYLQVAVDMFVGEAVPASHGHNFGDVAVGAWNGVAPSGLEPAAVDRIQGIISAYPYEDSMDN